MIFFTNMKQLEVKSHVKCQGVYGKNKTKMSD